MHPDTLRGKGTANSTQRASCLEQGPDYRVGTNTTLYSGAKMALVCAFRMQILARFLVLCQQVRFEFLVFDLAFAIFVDLLHDSFHRLPVRQYGRRHFAGGLDLSRWRGHRPSWRNRIVGALRQDLPELIEGEATGTVK